MKKFNNIVYVLNDRINESSTTFLRAVSLARINQADLTLMRIIPNMPTVISSKLTSSSEKELQNKVLAQEHAKLQTLITSLDAALDIKTEVKIGKKYIEVIRAVKAHKYDLLLKEVENIDWLERLFGSEDMHLLRKCPCPVLLMKKNEKSAYKNIMVAIDFDDDFDKHEYSYNDELNQKLLQCAISLSLSDFTTLHLVNVFDVPHSGYISLWADQPDKIEKELFETEYRTRQYKMNALLEALKLNIGAELFEYLSPQTQLVQGTPSHQLPKLAEEINADLVIMGTVARSGIAGILIGNTAENVLSQLQCSVLAIKPRDFVSPVS